MAQVLKTQWDGLAGLLAATLLTILSVLDILPTALVGTATLGVLALVCFSMIRTNVDHDAMTTVVTRLESAVSTLSENIRHIDGLHGVPHHKIGPALLGALTHTTFWRFKGGTGTYLRAETLPRLALSKERVVPRVWIEIIDPSNRNCCKTYADYRTKIRAHTTQNENEIWSHERVRIEGYATIIAALWYASNFNMMIQIALSSTVSTFRYDMSDDFVIITNEERDSTALRAEEGSNFYDRFEAELDLSFNQARYVDLAKSKLPVYFDGSDVHHALCELLGRDVNGGFLTDEICTRIAAKAISEGHAIALGWPRDAAAHNPYT